MSDSAEQALMAAAVAGQFPRAGSFKKRVDTGGGVHVMLGELEPRPYRIRLARKADVATLVAIEQECWEPALCMPEAVLRARVRRNPAGQLVLEKAGAVVGVIYAQRIGDEAALQGVAAVEADALHQDDGPVVHVMGLCIRPFMQDGVLSDQLLEFALQRCSVLKGVRVVVGVTRCRDYAVHPRHRSWRVHPPS